MTAAAPTRAGFAGTPTLLRLAARRDRIGVPLGVAALVAMVASTARATLGLYPDATSALPATRDVIDNPALVALYGPLSDPTSLDALATFKTVLLGALFLCLLAYAIVRRHTRTEEEEGRLELLGAGVVGRRAPLAAAVIAATAAVIVTSGLVTAAAVLVGLAADGSIALGVGWAAVGLTWVGVTAVAAQVASTTRGTAALAVGALGIAYAVRIAGDSAPDDSALRHLTWLSPLGWVEKIAPYGANRLAVGLLGLAAYVVLVGVSFALLERRDLGGGLLAPREGPATGRISTPFGLAARLARGTVLAWLVGVTVLGSVIGAVADNVQGFLESPQVRDLLERLGGSFGDLVDLYFATEFGFAAVAAAALGVTLTVRLRGEEASGRAEPLLATPTRRLPWALAHVGLAVGATTLVMASLGVVIGLVRGAQVGDVPGQVVSLLGAAIVTLPAVWVCIGVAVLLFGLAPRWTSAAWAVLLAFFGVGEFGPLLELPGWLVDLSPFSHLPGLPGGDLRVLPLVVLTATAAGLVAIGLGGLSRRDIG